MSETPRGKRLDAFCYHCGADFSDWEMLSAAEREAVHEKNPDISIHNLYDWPMSCPCCGFPYHDEDEDDEF